MVTTLTISWGQQLKNVIFWEGRGISYDPQKPLASKTHSPVEGITHLYGYKNRKCHCHRIRGLKDCTIHSIEVWVVLLAL